jgi:hypothetical protein
MLRKGGRCVRVDQCKSIQVGVRVYIYAYIYKHIYMYIYIYIHIYINNINHILDLYEQDKDIN